MIWIGSEASRSSSKMSKSSYRNVTSRVLADTGTPAGQLSRLHSRCLGPWRTHSSTGLGNAKIWTARPERPECPGHGRPVRSGQDFISSI
jgi:hypothetical protein